MLSPAVKLDRCVGNCYTRTGLSSKVRVTNKTENSNINVLNLITGKNE